MGLIRVCCFCESWGSGGIESFLNNTLSYMDRSEIEVDIITACLKESVFTSDLEEKGIGFFELSGSQYRIFKNNRMFRDLLRERKYDVVHFNLFQGLSLRFVHIAKQAKVPVRIAHSHNTALRKNRITWLKMILHRMGRARFTRDATELWACSEKAAEFLFSPRILAKKTYHFIPNGIETERFCFDNTIRTAIRSELNLTDNFVIGNIGRLCYQKNQDFLLDVFTKVVEARPNSRLLLVGEGDWESRLKAKAAQLQIADKVLFYGATNQPEYLYSAMDVFAFPSLFEGLGIVAVEAQASGLPVICSEHIPPEARVTALTKALSLNSGVSVWAQMLIESKPNLDRTAGAQLVQHAGFDIASAALKVQYGYTEFFKEVAAPCSNRMSPC